MPPFTPDERLRAFGNQLIEVHLWLREELTRLRDGVDDPDVRPRELRAHCLAFCAALTRHHTGEDAGAFRVLADQVPELAPVLRELAADHHLVAETLRRVEQLVGGTAPPDEVRTELDTLAALLETHFVYEEKKLVGALNALTEGSTEDLLGVSLPPPEGGPDRTGPIARRGGRRHR
ncbi:hemerythrin domain-containing protein [Micromonospora peucetia]|uniref:hemerythrin domain-containing protein n=1 Tax=Micromonospora peucetia TaxID=47871 RepID=UPI00225A5C1D|nr:hemerythrin domain-containing protein [Micromonospora peucetia]MCX4388635.1 hemerythrin domain-containing protein [Micromonospora peucetia]